MGAVIEIDHINRIFGSGAKQFQALTDINAVIPASKLTILKGRSGSGKTTLLNIIGALDEPTDGEIRMNGESLRRMSDRERENMRRNKFGFVFQAVSLIPTMSAYQNVEFALRMAGQKGNFRPRVTEMLHMVGLGSRMNHMPAELSGGEQQRVAIARAIASSPKLLLLDEPLSNLDARLRIDMRAELKRLHRETGTTIIYVTHDQVEALTMSTKIALFKEGEISQIATPLELYTNPIDLQAADFIGNPRINFIDAKGRLDGEDLRVKSAFGEYVFTKDRLKTDEEIPQGREFDCVLGLRPEMVDIYTEDPHHKNTVEATVYANQPAGSETLVTLTVDGTEFLAIQTGLVEYDMNQKVFVVLHPGRMNVYNKETGRLIKFAKTKHKAGVDD